MYWTHTQWNFLTRTHTNVKIQRANLHGSNVEDIITGLDFPRSIALGIPTQTPPSTPDLVVETTEDVNGDGVVNIQDLVQVAGALGETGQNAADVNGDGVVNIQDLVLVAGALGQNGAAAPSLHTDALVGISTADVKVWLSQARQRDMTDPNVRKGIQFLEQLLVSMIPKETALLSNYPNPFNPETWIPYRLSKPAEVMITIYAANGHAIRRLTLGHQPAGMYQSRSRAAYWDGRNAVGEPVASGVYFYTLTAGDFSRNPQDVNTQIVINCSTNFPVCGRSTYVFFVRVPYYIHRKHKEIRMKMLVMNPKITLSILTIIMCVGWTTTSYSQAALSIEPAELTEAGLDGQKVTLKLTDQIWIKSARSIENALSVSGIEGVTFLKGYRTRTYTVFVCDTVPGTLGRGFVGDTMKPAAAIG